MSTLRYRAEGTVPYVLALVVLAEHARASADEFDFGPLRPALLQLHGLVVAGPDLQEVARLLAQVPGLVLTGD